MTRARFAIALGCLAAACAPVSPVKFDGPALVRASPVELGFLCVSPGCDTQRKVTFTVEGGRRLVIKRTLVEGDDPGEFSIESDQQVPAVLGPGSSLTVTVRYRPTGAPAEQTPVLRVTWADASTEDSPDRVMPGEVKVALLRRILGEAVLTAAPAELSFGFVAAGSKKVLPVTLRNEGHGTVYAVVERVDGGVGGISVDPSSLSPIAPDAGLEVPVAFAPVGEAHVETTLVFVPAGTADPVSVHVEGTSLSTGKGVFSPAALDFGELPKGQQRTLQVQLTNIGGQSMNLSELSVSDPSGNVTLKQPIPTGPVVVGALERLPITLEVKGVLAGEVHATLRAVSAGVPVLLDVTGMVTDPVLALNPMQVDFGQVATGWVATRTVELRNAGYGPLTVKRVALVGGSSTLFSVTSLPPLPLALLHDQRTVVELQFRADTAGAATGSLSIETDANSGNFTVVPLKATAGTCVASCPTAHGTPSCTTGVCTIASCAAGWYDTDKVVANGCECAEPVADPGSFCATGTDLGTLKDTDHAQASVTGVLPIDGDIDVLRFFAQDAFSLGLDDYDVKVKLVSADPNIQLCVYRYDTGSHQTDCFFTNESCPANRMYEKTGGLGGDDADYIVKVLRAPNKAPTCSQYTVTVSNGL